MHEPVLLKETIKLLNPKPKEFFIDGTVNGGGHARAILEKIGSKGMLLAIDWDNELLESFKLKTKNKKSKIIYDNDNYANLPKILKKHKLGKADGLLLDLGFSSEQLEAGGGFSFKKNEILDMRYNKKFTTMTAANILNTFSKKELTEIFWKYGEERFSEKAAETIVEARQNTPIIMTQQLAEIVKKIMPVNYERGRIHPATRIFQALRIYVNKELENLETVLNNLIKILKPGGRAAIISFHSLEDRLVKNYFKKMQQQRIAQVLTKKPIIPSLEEISLNPRSRSAKLRAALITRY